MRFLELVLQARDPQALAAWYARELGLRRLDDGHAGVLAGATRIVFEPSPDGEERVHHFAFNVPEDRIEDALRWIRERAPVIESDEGAIVRYEAWDAHAVYFLDPAGNVGELIARHALPNASSAPFSGASLLDVSEVGLPSPSVPALAAALKEGLGVREYRPGWERFVPLGDERGLLILVPEGRAWFPGRAEARIHPIRVVHDGRSFETPGLPYRFDGAR